MTVKCFVKSSADMSEILNDSIQLVITNALQPKISFYIGGMPSRDDTSAFIEHRRILKNAFPALFRQWFLSVRDQIFPYTKNLLEIQRVLRNDGVLLWNVGNALIGSTQSFEIET